MSNNSVMVITGTRKGIGKYLVEYYVQKGFHVIGCSRKSASYELRNYDHFCLDVSDEVKVKEMFFQIRKAHNRLDVLINNAGVASMNHTLLTPLETVSRILDTNVVGTFLFCREAAKLMKHNPSGRIVNVSSVAVPLKLAGEAVYAASKAAVTTFTQVLARELSELDITVNTVGPAPTKTDLIDSVPQEKIKGVVSQQAIRRLSEYRDISNVIDFFIQPESDFITGQVIYLGGVS